MKKIRGKPLFFIKMGDEKDKKVIKWVSSNNLFLLFIKDKKRLTKIKIYGTMNK